MIIILAIILFITFCHEFINYELLVLRCYTINLSNLEISETAFQLVSLTESNKYFVAPDGHFSSVSVSRTNKKIIIILVFPEMSFT